MSALLSKIKTTLTAGYRSTKAQQQAEIEGNDETKTEAKSFGNSYSGASESFVDYLYNSGYEDLAAYTAISMYKQVMPFSDAIQRRATAFSQIPIRVRNKKTGEFEKDHPALELLSKPNADVSQLEFLEQLSSFYDITGDSFIVATGRIDREPLELAIAAPQLVTTADYGNRFGILNVPNSLRLSSVHGPEKIFPAEDYRTLGGIRFYSERENAELWHLRAFNPTRTSARFRGMSKAQPLWMELQQFIEGNTTNLSNLQRGTRLSMAWVNTSENELSQDQWDRVNEMAQKYAGSKNAGGTPVLDGMDVKTIQQTNREMEFDLLMRNMYSRISNAYSIPLALLLPDSMTMNNLQVSNLQFFDNSVLPLANRLYDEMTRMLMPRYKNSEDLEFAYNENDIPAVRARILESAKNQKEIGVSTINELRTVIGEEHVEEGGDDVYRATNLIVVGSEMDDTSGSSEEPEDDFDASQDPDIKRRYELELFRTGNYTPAEVKRLTAEYFGGD